MIIYDFEYDGALLSSKGYMVCTIGGNGLESASNGSKINFVTVPIRNGLYNELITSNYSDCVTATFSICKKPCYDENIQGSGTDMEISLQDFNDMAAWLNRRKFHKLGFNMKFSEQLTQDVFFDASFNLTKREYNGKIYAIDLEMITNRPHAYLATESSSGQSVVTVVDKSNEEGYIYPAMYIAILSSGTLRITNSADDGNDIEIKNCVSGEQITLDYPMISTNNTSHRSTLANDFNWNFPRIINSYTNKTNTYTADKTCLISCQYKPILKFGI